MRLKIRATKRFNVSVQSAVQEVVVRERSASMGRTSSLKLGKKPLAQTSLPMILCNSASVRGRRTDNHRCKYLSPRAQEARDMSIPKTTARATRKRHFLRLIINPTEASTLNARKVYYQTYYQDSPCVVTSSKKTKANRDGSKARVRSMMY